VNLYNNDFDLSNGGFYIKVDDSTVDYSDNLDNADPEFDIDGYHLTAESPCLIGWRQGQQIILPFYLGFSNISAKLTDLQKL
jgi:hypothetical protein